MTKKIIVLSTLACFLCGCQIFDLKDPEMPDTRTVTEDPLNIGEILSVVREVPVSMDYTDYFTLGAQFETPTTFRPVEGRGEIVQMLDRLRPQAQLVEWQTERGDRRVEGNRQSLLNVPYTVYPRAGETRTGVADFHFAREPDWRISYWKDMPDGIPFFEQ